MTLTFELPWPPTANTYWRRNGDRYFISKSGIAYRRSVYFLCRPFQGFFSSNHSLKINIHAYPPDKRKRDLDNLGKACMDAMQYAKVYDDDSQIDELTFKRMPENLDKIVVTIERIQ